MPRSAFFSKEDIAGAALEIVRHKGFEALTARALSKQLNCSLSPIFTVFKDMDEIQSAVKDAAFALFSDYVSDVIDYTPAFKEYGMRLIRFAKEEQNIFHMLFLQKGAKRDNVSAAAVECLRDVKEGYGLDDSQMSVLFRQMWTFACGIALLATKSPEDYPEELISEMLTTQFTVTLVFLKSGKPIENVSPHHKVEGEKRIMDL